MQPPQHTIDLLELWGRWQRGLAGAGVGIACVRCEGDDIGRPDEVFSADAEWLDRRLAEFKVEGPESALVYKALELRYLWQMSVPEASARSRCSPKTFKDRCDHGAWFVNGLLALRRLAA